MRILVRARRFAPPCGSRRGASEPRGVLRDAGGSAVLGRAIALCAVERAALKAVDVRDKLRLEGVSQIGRSVRRRLSYVAPAFGNASLAARLVFVWQRGAL